MLQLGEFFTDIRALNKKYKCIPLIIFAIIYVASPIDLLPELFFESWLFYLDDMAVLIFAFVITYLEVFSNERNSNDNEKVESIYSAIRRDSVELGSRRDIDSDSRFNSNAIHGALINQIPPAELPAPVYTSAEPEFTSDETESSTTEPELASDETESFTTEPDDVQPADDNSASFYEQHFINSASESNDYIRQISEQSRPESFIVDDGNAIIW